jgi:two-component system, chemotaxis family, CheB/CheR fusion protein
MTTDRHDGAGTDAERIRLLEERVRDLEEEATRCRDRLTDMMREARNALAIIRVMVRRTAGTSRSVDAFALHLEGRIGAVSRTQATVLRSPDATVDLAGLVADELLAGAAQGYRQATVEGPPVRLPARKAAALGVAIHELTMNALKFGALSSPDGRLKVEWEMSLEAGGPVLAFRWEESGPCRLSTPGPRGVGMEVLERSLPYQTGAVTAVDFRPEGIRVAIRMQNAEPASGGR